MHKRMEGDFSKRAQSAKLESPVADRKPAKLTGREARFHCCKREFRKAESGEDENTKEEGLKLRQPPRK